MLEGLAIRTGARQKTAAVLIFLLIFCTPRALEIDRFVATDEGAWLYRAGDFLYALGQRDFEQTYTTGHPGVVTSWIGAAAHLIEDPDYYRLQQSYFGEYDPYEAFLLSRGVDPFEILITARWIMLVFLTALMAVCLILFIDLVGLVPAAIGFGLLAIDPFFIALTRMYHLDAPMAVLSLLSLSVLGIYLRRINRSPGWLFLSGLIGGAAGLAKLPSALLFPAVLIILTIEAFQHAPGSGRQKWIEILKATARTSLVWGLGALVAVVVFWPAMWVQPIGTIQNLWNMATDTTTGTLDTGKTVVAPTTLFFYNPLEHSYTVYLVTFLWRTTPFIWLGLVSAGFAWIKQAGIWARIQARRLNSYLLVFAGVYLIFMSIAQKQSQKYILPAYLILILIAGFGLAELPALMRKLGFNPKIEGATIGLLVLGFAYQLLVMMPTYPYYWTFYNPALGGSEKAGETIFVGTGEGLDLAAEYLNAKPNASELVVTAWYGTGCLSYYFEGQVFDIDHDNRWEEKELDMLAQSDYLLLYSNQWFRNKPAKLLAALENIEPEHRVWLDGIEYVRIYHVSQIPDSMIGE